ncbi:hypothetical protein [Methanoculleus sp.]|jgi:hypothetical protein|uniref:hypothetical protein n=1 Tax=Methanoculleus sp. TaxID=90427 RepID=UPI0026253350|nr:hypothetical protein [Methanoculleus sp.]MDD2255365.1 hypothetical protein [Methanoculleus sp.]
MTTQIEDLELDVRKKGSLKITSSGYEDRWTLADIYLEIDTDDVQFRVDGSSQWPAAYCKLAGLPVNAENLRRAREIIALAPFATTITYEFIHEHGRGLRHIRSSSHRLNAGINVATGRAASFSPEGAQEAAKIASDLSRDEWDAIKDGLERVNRDHERLGRPVVAFTIPNFQE